MTARTAFSTPDTGETIAQGRYGLPVFLANMQFTVTNLIKRCDKEGGFKPGDLWIINDPYVSGTHLQDVVLIAPLFRRRRTACAARLTGHWMDIGGSVPGGWAPKATEIHQEGMIIPPMKLYDGGQAERGAGQRCSPANVRLPTQIAGDLSAMCNVFHVGRRGLDALVARYGLDKLTDRASAR